MNATCRELGHIFIEDVCTWCEHERLPGEVGEFDREAERRWALECINRGRHPERAFIDKYAKGGVIEGGDA